MNEKQTERLRYGRTKGDSGGTVHTRFPHRPSPTRSSLPVRPLRLTAAQRIDKPPTQKETPPEVNSWADGRNVENVLAVGRWFLVELLKTTVGFVAGALASLTVLWLLYRALTAH